MRQLDNNPEGPIALNLASEVDGHQPLQDAMDEKDLVPPSTPKGIIAFVNIAPALVAKIGWPYLLKGRIRYTKRLIGCCLLSSIGMIVVAAFDSLNMRLLGIGLASFSSGLGELTFLQLSTTYAPPSVAGRSVGYFASGTGAAGLVGAFLWWEVRNLGVRVGVGVSIITVFLLISLEGICGGLA
ncbi:hypothetical protein C0992_005479 [Termitomyces sp. T32_za158]|nr:hypothetical protein C0992_005479 [Termitomyces sp. T32_za158]